MEETEDNNNSFKTAEEVLENKLKNALTMVMFLDHFTTFVAEEEQWELQLDLLSIKYHEFMKIMNDEGKEVDLALMVTTGLHFISSHEMFSAHEFTATGAQLSPKELTIFKQELTEAMRDKTKRKIIASQLAVVGYEMMKFLMVKQPYLQKQIDDKVNEYKKIAGAEIIRDYTEKLMMPWKKGLMIIDKLKDVEITIDKDGNVDDPRGIVERNKKQNAARGQSQGTPGTESPEV